MEEAAPVDRARRPSRASASRLLKLLRSTRLRAAVGRCARRTPRLVAPRRARAHAARLRPTCARRRLPTTRMRDLEVGLGAHEVAGRSAPAEHVLTASEHPAGATSWWHGGVLGRICGRVRSSSEVGGRRSGSVSRIVADQQEQARARSAEVTGVTAPRGPGGPYLASLEVVPIVIAQTPPCCSPAARRGRYLRPGCAATTRPLVGGGRTPGPAGRAWRKPAARWWCVGQAPSG